MEFTLQQIAEICGGRLFGAGETLVKGFFTDSRQAEKGKMFVPIVGENVDAHSFIDLVFEKQAAAFSQRALEAPKGSYVLVEDSVKALQEVALAYRKSLRIPLVAVTGSVGKTTTKEMVALGLEAELPVLKTAGNANSQVGLPLTLMRIGPEHRAAVIEMGMSMPGEMARIAYAARPQMAVFTNVGVSHIEFHGSREKILEEKLHVTDYFTEDSVLFVNGDDDLLCALKGAKPYRVVEFGVAPHCDYRAADIREGEDGSRFLCCRGGEEIPMFVPVPGLHNVRNALASLAVAEALGVHTAAAVQAIAGYTPPAMRQQIQKIAGCTVIDDTYNASPDSMVGALDILAKLPGGKKIAVLADMLELGSYAEKGHRDVGNHARALGIDWLLCIGTQAAYMADAFGNSEKSRLFATTEEAAAFLQELLEPGDAVLVKGSRGMKTDRIVKGLEEWAQQEKTGKGQR